MKKIPELHTNNCVMNAITMDDISVLHEIVEDELFHKFMPELYVVVNSIEGLSNFINSFSIYAQKKDGYLWGIRKKSNLIGFVAIMDLSNKPTVFYAMHPKYSGKGYAKECVFAVVRYYKEISHFPLYTEVFKENLASSAILMYCGFKKTVINGKKYLWTLMNNELI